jgi:hypothetical protein
MDSAPRAFLLLADISGFTKFMQQKTISLNHAKQIVVRLLKAIVSNSSHPLTVAELEGDAVFLYAAFDDHDETKIASSVRKQMEDFFTAFEQERASINDVTTCSCNACQQVAGLKLKQIIHVGSIATETIDRFEKLFGLDVILVHRLLKNSVKKKEYVMMTRPAYKAIGEFFGHPPERHTESYEGVGTVETLVFYPDSGSENHEPISGRRGAPVLRKLGWRLEISYGFLVDLVGIRRFVGRFDNIPE